MISFLMFKNKNIKKKLNMYSKIEIINLKNKKLLNFSLLNFAIKIFLKLREKIFDIKIVNELTNAKLVANISSLFRTNIININVANVL